MLSRTVNTLEEVQDENLRAYYVANQDGTFTLDLEDKEGGELRGKVGQVTAQRDEANTKLKEAMDSLAPFLAINKTSTELSEGLSRLATLEIQADQNANADPAETEKRVGDEVDRRLAAMKREFDNQITGLASQVDVLTIENDGMRITANRTVIRDSLQNALGSVAAPQKNAFDDILRRAEAEFRVNPETKEIEAFDAQGNRKFALNGKAPLAMTEWVEGLHNDSPYLFVPSTGGGSSSSAGARAQHVPGGSGPIVDVSDPVAFGKNLKAIAEGTSRNVNNN